MKVEYVVRGTGVLLLAVLVGLAARVAHGGTGTVVNMPTNPANVRNGLAVEVDGRWINGNGIRPIRVKLSHFPPGPAGVRRLVTITLEPYGPRADRPLISVSEVFELPGDVPFMEKIVRVPQAADWRGCRIEVTENGGRLRDLTGDLPGLNTLAGKDWTEALPSLLLIDRDVPPWTQRTRTGTSWIHASPLAKAGSEGNATDGLPNLTVLTQALPEVSNNQRVTYYGPAAMGMGSVVTMNSEEPELKKPPEGPSQHPGFAAIASEIQATPRLEMLSPDDVPERWIDLSAADLIFITLDDLAYLARTPDKLAAVRDWVSAGQTLLVSQLGPDLARSAELEALLGMSGAAGPPSSWQRPMDSDFGIGFLDATNLLGGTTTVQYAGTNAPPPKFRLGRMGMGRVVAFEDADPTQDGRQFLWAMNALDSTDWAWFQRFGQSRHRSNAGFFEMRIPGVGDPPVVSFLVLITVFTLGIGPINYWWLKRRRRLYLLLVTVPVGAGLVTVLLLVYALLADGLGVRGRTKSLTFLDRSAGRAVTWSRQAYYAGMTPSRGMVYSENTLVVPFEAAPDPMKQRRSATSEMHWNNEQFLRSGFLRPRQLTQFMVVDVGPSAARLDVDWSGQTIQNELGAKIQRVFVRGDDGTWLVGEDIALGQAGKLVPSAENQAQIALKNVTQFLTEDSVQSMRSWNRWYWNSVDMHVREPATSTSILEQQLARVRNLRELPPRCYIVTLDQTPWLPVGVERARYDDSLHVVLGVW